MTFHHFFLFNVVMVDYPQIWCARSLLGETTNIPLYITYFIIHSDLEAVKKGKLRMPILFGSLTIVSWFIFRIINPR
jgi:hypothetical protein